MTREIAQAKLIQLKKALESFNIGILANPSEIERDGAIQRFEYSFELSWKTLKTVLEYLGVEDCKSPRRALQAGLIQGFVEVKDQEMWLAMLDDRNKTTHIYHKDIAISIFQSLPEYLDLMKTLQSNLYNELEGK